MLIQLEWSEQYAVGHESLDNEHRHLVDLINAIYKAGGSLPNHSELNPLLRNLLDLAGKHFRHENSILLQINSSPIPSGIDRNVLIKAIIEAAFDKHIESHARMLPQLGSIVRGIRKELDSADPLLSTRLKDWFIEHATTHDAYLRPVFRALNRPTG